MSKSSDVFISYNNADKPIALEISKALKKRNLKVWLDIWEIAPGQAFQDGLQAGIKSCRSACVLIGQAGLGQWEKEELQALMDRAVEHSIPLIPVILPDASSKPNLPPLLKQRSWVNLAGGITEDESSPECCVNSILLWK